MLDYIIRIATQEDAEAIYQIYEPYILNTAVTFEYDPITIEDYKERMRKVQKQFPWLVCEMDGKVLGYAYCTAYRERAAFAWDCECSVYVDHKVHRKGVATELYHQLFEYIKKQGYYNVYAYIALPHESSVAFHKKFGFREIGIYSNTGYKLNHWWDLLVMGKQLNEYPDIPLRPESFQDQIKSKNSC